jgi:membrane associated rhomboid family serine protease
MSELLDKAKGVWQRQGIIVQIIAINVILFIALNISRAFDGHLKDYLTLPHDLQSFGRHPWTFITSIFSQELLGHIFVNMLWFYMLARIFHVVTGFSHWSKITFIYLAGGMVGNLFMFASAQLFPQFINFPYGLGASGAVMAIALAVAIHSPDYSVNLLLFGEVKLKWVVTILFVITTLVDLSLNPGGKIAHLGGAAFGALYGFQLRRGSDMSAWLTNLFKPRHRVKMKVVHQQGRPVSDIKYNEIKRDDERILNELLDKINRSGYESLSKKEKETLHILSKKK